MKAAIYARVSTSDQHNEIQIRELTEFISRRGWELAGVYEDEMSGAKTRRPGLDRLMDDARLHLCSAINPFALESTSCQQMRNDVTSRRDLCYVGNPANP